MTNDQIRQEVVFRRREQLLKNYGIKLTYKNNTSFVYVQYQNLNIPISFYSYKNKSDDDFLIQVLMEFKSYNYYPKIEMNSEDLKKKLHRKKVLLEDYYIIPVHSLNDNLNFKLRKMQLNGNIEIPYSYDDYCNKPENKLIDDILDKFRRDVSFRETKPSNLPNKILTSTTYTPKPVEKRPNVDMLSKWENNRTPITPIVVINVDEKKKNIRNILIEKGICQQIV